MKLTDEERLDYMLDRSDRDIVHGKGMRPQAPKDEKEKKEKKPFEDRVLNKALEYLRGEINAKPVRAGGRRTDDAIV